MVVEAKLKISWAGDLIRAGGSPTQAFEDANAKMAKVKLANKRFNIKVTTVGAAGGALGGCLVGYFNQKNDKDA